MDKLSLSSQEAFIGNKQLQSINKSQTRAGEEKNSEEGSHRDRVELSEEGKALAKAGIAQELTFTDLQKVQKLQKRDTEVQVHEQAHLAAAGGYARGGANLSYEKGPDGKSYAVEGSVQIDTSQEKTPEATISKMRTVRQAALAPANPSGADKQVAAQATAKEQRAREELAKKDRENGSLGKAAEPGADKHGEPLAESSKQAAPPQHRTRLMVQAYTATPANESLSLIA
ncbi:putative metalloprotease CJM1_0395 family protein [Desulfotalea psychrophila]|uniref:SrpA-related protein n=1 Tax=Desulfotalea psychrophila (strain LSv54 / DSM 12343) TaxID=177439 RepID=Q6AL64_DESPS|nr:putative metalloprotease CJM1_0395 family protein [Desulfotalea psychrophila]CAG36911.1 unknown protein [Desulfotalea psychrophila LSv54]